MGGARVDHVWYSSWWIKNITLYLCLYRLRNVGFDAQPPDNPDCHCYRLSHRGFPAGRQHVVASQGKAWVRLHCIILGFIHVACLQSVHLLVDLGLGWLEFWVFNCRLNYAWADGSLAEAIGQLGYMVKHRNQSHPNQGPWEDGTPVF